MWLRADFCGLTFNFNFSDPDGPGGGAGWNPVDPRSLSCVCVDARSLFQAWFVSAPCWRPLAGRRGWGNGCRRLEPEATRCAVPCSAVQRRDVPERRTLTQGTEAFLLMPTQSTSQESAASSPVPNTCTAPASHPTVFPAPRAP